MALPARVGKRWIHEEYKSTEKGVEGIGSRIGHIEARVNPLA